ncbi:hypothetical protein CAP35_13145 [Chitinophagaceae bacterium IBVUCB1]|nr:hypothetical protein CAP35_13145 [Chitinophagaceae bacterium IBVUCB1]
MKPYIHYNTDLERGVLGICVLHAGTYSSVHHLLSDTCFYEQKHLAVYRAMRSLWVQGQSVEATGLIAELYITGVHTIDGAPAAMFVTELCDEPHPASHLEHWCIRLRELAARRMMQQLSSIPDDTADITTTALQLHEQIREALSISHVSKWVSATEAAARLDAHRQSDKVNGISTTISILNELNGGFAAGHLIVIGARPSVGKSALACNIALQAALAGHCTAMVSMEMGVHELYARMASLHSGIPFKQVMKKDAPPNTVLPAGLPLYFADDAQMTIHDIRSHAEHLLQTNGLQLLIVDYLQLIQEHADSKRPREQQIAAISRGLKMIAMTLNIPVIALSQLNRESEHRQNKRPTLADLRESGTIEQDADVVMLLHRDWQAGIRHTETGDSTICDADLIVSKWRNGCTTDIRLHFDGGTMRFGDMG